jgi:hypothetical protein
MSRCPLSRSRCSPNGSRCPSSSPSCPWNIGKFPRPGFIEESREWKDGYLNPVIERISDERLVDILHQIEGDIS